MGNHIDLSASKSYVGRMMDFDKKYKRGEQPKTCFVDGCGKKTYCKGFCEKHYRRIKRGNITPKRNVQEGNDIERFLAKIKINDNGCWIWQAGKAFNNKGIAYGKHFSDEKKTVLAHRFSYQKHCGEIPKGMLVCHKCDTPLCVNPDHLFVGSHRLNMKDMVEKGRSYKAYGEDMHTSKLSNKQAIEIRESVLSTKEISKIYNISRSTIRRIKLGVTYRNA